MKGTMKSLFNLLMESLNIITNSGAAAQEIFFNIIPIFSKMSSLLPTEFFSKKLLIH
jgi:hypothetical protein